MTDYAHIVDLSRYNGTGDFTKARAAGIEGFILRATHGLTIDVLFHAYHEGALAAGYTDNDLCFYSFCNPKRTTGAAGANFFLDTVHAELGHLATGLMLDIESYAKETPTPGATIPAQVYAVWLHEFVTVCRTAAPEAVTFGYTNDAYWRGGVETPLSVDDDWLVANLDWLVARYPAYSHDAYTQHPLPGPDGWEQWAFTRAPQGPVPPAGAPWAGWQFSAGFNGQAARYGFQGDDLDLSIVRRDAWNRWTHRSVAQPIVLPPPVTSTTPVVVTPVTPIPIPILEEDDMANAIYISDPTAPADEQFTAEFFAVVNSQLAAIQVEWTGEGSDPAVTARIAAHRAAGAVEVPVRRDGFRNATLLGPVPPGFGPADFARVVG